MSQFEQISLHYNQLINIADEITRLIDKELYDDILTKMELHERLLARIKTIKNNAEFSEKELSQIHDFETILKVKEKRNIDTMQNNMAEVKTELNKVKFKSKVQNTYNQDTSLAEQGSIIDVDDSYKFEK